MKTYTFKIKVDYDKVVVACHMQLEQFYDSVKMSGMESLVERYPHTFITASDYFYGANSDNYNKDDYSVSTLADLIYSKDLKAYLLSDSFNGFVDDDFFSSEKSDKLVKSASDFIMNQNKVLEDEVNYDGLSETEK